MRALTATRDNSLRNARVGAPLDKSPSEIWDDDFEFQSGLSHDERNVEERTSPSQPRESLDVSSQHRRFVDPTLGIVMFNSGSAGGSSRSPTVDPLKAWESPPSSAKKNLPILRKAPVHLEENWDDDFIDKTGESPIRPTHTQGSPSLHENWDEDFDTEISANRHGSPSAFGSGIGSGIKAVANASPSSKRTRTEVEWNSSSSSEESLSRRMDDDKEFGLMDGTMRARRADEEDRTLTSRSRRKMMITPSMGNSSSSQPPLPPVPMSGTSQHPQHPSLSIMPTIPSGDVPFISSVPLQHPPFPRSPTLSAFSIPATLATSTTNSGSASAYGSTAHLTGSLRRSLSASSGVSPRAGGSSKRFPATSPSRPPRERRRLRKKSRPPMAHIDGTLIELEDRREVEGEVLNVNHYGHRPMTPENRPRRSVDRSLSRSRRAPSPYRDSIDSTGSPMDIDIVEPATNFPLSTMSTTNQMSLYPSSDASPSTMASSHIDANKGKERSPLLTRIGSVKRWSAGMGLGGLSGAIGGRRKRSSTGPEVVSAIEMEQDREENSVTPKPRSYAAVRRPSSPPPPLPLPLPRMGAKGSSSDFFREENLEEIWTTAASRAMRAKENAGDPSSLLVIPGGQRSKGFNLHDNANVASSSLAELESVNLGQYTDNLTAVRAADRDIHMRSPTASPPKPRKGLRPRLASYRAPKTTPTKPPLPRHVSGSVIEHNQRGIEDSREPADSNCDIELQRDVGDTDTRHVKEEGSRMFMTGVRRISFGSIQRRASNKHRRQKSSNSISVPVGHDPAEDADMINFELPPVPPVPQPKGNPDVDSKTLGPLLPPVELMTAPLRSSSLPKLQVAFDSRQNIDITSPMPGPPLRDTSNISVPPPTSSSPLLHSRSSNYISSRSSNSNSSNPSTSPSSRKGAAVSRVGAMKGLNSSPQSASLGRATSQMIASGKASSALGPNAPAAINAAMRRNSLGDLKIPSRISRAQDGLKRDLTRVREFASHIEQMRDQRSEYYGLIDEVQQILDAPSRPPSRILSPSVFNMTRPASRARSNTNPTSPPTNSNEVQHVAATFRAIDSKYLIAWECAELLIDLGSGAGVMTSPTSPPLPTLSSSGPTLIASSSGSVGGMKKGRERAVTLAGDESKPSTPITGSPVAKKTNDPNPPALLSWRASTGRHDLNQRQLFLLKEMLNNADSAKDGVPITEHKIDVFNSSEFATQRLADTAAGAIQNWNHEREGLESTVTLPTEESSAAASSPQKKRQSSKLGLLAIRDMLRSLKRGYNSQSSSKTDSAAAQSTTTLSTETSSYDVHRQSFSNNSQGHHPYPSQQLRAEVADDSSRSRSPGRMRSKTTVPAESMRIPSSHSSTIGEYPRKPYMSGISLSQSHQQHRSSPRRPSLASLFRLGQKYKSTGSSSSSGPDVVTKQESGSSKIALPIVDRSRHGTEDEGDDSDWDRMDSTSDVDVATTVSMLESSLRKVDTKGTLKGRRNFSRPHSSHGTGRTSRVASPPPTYSRPVTPGLLVAGNPSQVSLVSATANQSTTQLRLPRLSNVDEDYPSGSPSGRVTPSSPTGYNRIKTYGRDDDRRNLPQSRSESHTNPIPVFDVGPIAPEGQMKLSMTPENIKPLLENAKVVTARLAECILEVKALLVGRAIIAREL